MSRIFISHSSRDNHEAIAFKQWLGEHGWDGEDVFLDLHGIGTGARWKDALKAANARCEAVVFLASPEALESPECRLELRMAEDYGKPVLVAILRDLSVVDPRLELYRENQIVSLAEPGAVWQGQTDHAGERRTVRLALAALESINVRLKATGIAPSSYPWPPADRPGAPIFPGLAAYEPADAAIFFGRDADMVRGLDRLRLLRRAGRPRMLAIQSASGAGKSSFLRAGLWPRLKRDADYAPLAIVRPAGGIISGPFGLGRQLGAWFKAQGEQRNPGDIAAGLEESDTGLSVLIAEMVQLAWRARKVGDPDAVRPAALIAIDQAEELFAKADMDESERFLDQLASILAAPPDGAQPLILLTIRADSIDPLLQAMASRGMEPADAFNLPPMPAEAYRAVIEGPVAVANRAGRKLAIDPDLVETLAKDARGADALPLLAFTLQRLDADYGADGRLELSEYRELGGVEGSIRRALAEARAGPGAAASDEALRRLFVPMLATWDAGAGEPKRLRAGLAGLVGGPRAALRPLLDALVEKRLLMRDGDILEVAHEALLRQPPLYDWLSARKDALRLRDDILREAHEWEEQARAAKNLVRRGERLKDALDLAEDADFGLALGGARPYLTACLAYETRERDRQRRIIGRAFVKPAAQAVAEGRFDAALRLAAAGAVLAEDPDFALVPELWQAVAGAAFGNARAVLHGHEDSVWSAAFSPDGTLLVTASGDKTARIWIAATGAEVACLQGHEGGVTSAAFSPDGARVVTASHDSTARVWDAATGAEIACLKGHKASVESAAFSPDGARVVTVSKDSTARIWVAETGAAIARLQDQQSAAFSPDGARVVTVSNTGDSTTRIWDAATGAEIACLQGHENGVMSAAFSLDGARLFTMSKIDARIWDAATGAEIACLKGHEGWISSGSFSRAAFSPDGARLVTFFRDNTARVWDAATGAEVACLQGHEDWATNAVFSPDGARLVTGSYDGTARVWDAATGAEIACLNGHENSVHSAAFSPDGTLLVTVSEDKTARVWDAAMGAEITCIRDHEGWTTNAVFSPDGARVVTGSHDGTVRVWDAATGAEIARLQGHEEVVNSAAFSPDGNRLVTVSEDRTARIWIAATGEEVACLQGHEESVLSAAFSPDGARVVTASWDNTARVWDAATGAEIARLKGHEASVTSAAFSPDGARVVTVSDDSTARIWVAETGAAIARLQDEWSAAFSPDGARLVTRFRDNTARVWDAATGAEVACLQGHEESVYSAAFSPDGARLVTGSHDGTARVWDAATGAEIACLKGHENSVHSAAFSPDGTLLVTVSEDKTARVWDAATGVEVACLQGHEGGVTSAAFSPDGARLFTASDDGTARVWDVAASRALSAGVPAVMAGSLADGRGRRSKSESEDLLMQDAPDDLLAAFLALRPETARDIEKVKAQLQTRHPDRYLSPTQLAERARSAPPVAEPAQKSSRRVPGRLGVLIFSFALALLAAAATALFLLQTGRLTLP